MLFGQIEPTDGNVHEFMLCRKCRSHGTFNTRFEKPHARIESSALTIPDMQLTVP